MAAESSGPGAGRGVSRRGLFTATAGAAAAGIAAGAAGTVALRSEGGSGAAELWRKPTDSEAPAVRGVHLQYGADAAREAVVSWHTTVSVTAPRVRLTPAPTDTGHGPYDTSKGTVHLVIGGGGTSAPSTGMLSPDPHCNVITGLGEVGPLLGKRLPTTVPEPAPWSAFRDMTNPYGFCCFDVDPGSPGGHTTITATYYALVGPRSEPTPVDTFTPTRPRP
ncbi:hypothetical protein [Nocardia sp. NPDC004123]